MPELVSMVSVHIAPERVAEVVEGFGAAVRAGMPERRHTSLLRGEGGLMRLVTVWRSRDHLDRYLAGVDKPFVVGLLESAGGETVVDVLELVRISEVIIHHADLDTVWGLGEADMDALEDTLEIVVERVSANEDFPGVTVDTDEGEHYDIGDGATAIKGGRDAVIGWLARGLTDGLRYDGELPERPARSVG